MFKPEHDYILQYYVYILVNPINQTVFYIGKGKGNRVFEHEIEAVEMDALMKKEKLTIIRKIHNQGLKVEKYIISYGLTEREAFYIENAMIDFCRLIGMENLSINQLSNLMSGHRSANQKASIRKFGKVEDLISAISPVTVPASQFADKKIMFVKVKPTLKEADLTKQLSIQEMYQYDSEKLKARTLGIWKMAQWRADSVEYIMGVYPGSGFIVSAYHIPKAAVRFNKSGGRYDFTPYGELITELNGVSLFPRHIKITGTKIVDEAGNITRMQYPLTYNY